MARDVIFQRIVWSSNQIHKLGRPIENYFVFFVMFSIQLNKIWSGLQQQFENQRNCFTAVMKTLNTFYGSTNEWIIKVKKFSGKQSQEFWLSTSDFNHKCCIFFRF